MAFTEAEKRKWHAERKAGRGKEDQVRLWCVPIAELLSALAMPIQNFHYVPLASEAVDYQLETFSVVDVSGGSCWNPPLGSRKPVGRLRGAWADYGAFP